MARAAAAAAAIDNARLHARSRRYAVGEDRERVADGPPRHGHPTALRHRAPRLQSTAKLVHDARRGTARPRGDRSTWTARSGRSARRSSPSAPASRRRRPVLRDQVLAVVAEVARLARHRAALSACDGPIGTALSDEQADDAPRGAPRAAHQRRPSRRRTRRPRGRRGDPRRGDADGRGRRHRSPPAGTPTGGRGSPI